MPIQSKILAKHLGKLVWGSALAVLFALALRCGIHLVSHNYNLSFEGNGLYGLLNASEGKAVYPSKESVPYHVFLYPALQPIVFGNLLSILPVSAVHAKVLLLRFSNLLLMAAAFWILWRTICRPLKVSGAMYALALSLGLSRFADYATTSRNDALSLLCEVAVVAMGFRYLEKRRLSDLLLLVSAATASFLARQSGIAAIGAVLLWLLVRRDFRETLKVAVLYGLFNLAAFGLCQYFTDGNYVTHVFLANARPILLQFDRSYYGLAFFGFIVSYVLFAGASVVGMRSIPRIFSMPTSGIPFIACILSFILACVALPRPAGDTNYFLESFFFAMPFCALGIERVLNRSREIASAAIALQLAFIAAITVGKSMSAYSKAFLPYEETATALKRSIPSYGVLSGSMALNLIVHLRGWAYHGPDLTSGGVISHTAHPKFRYLREDLIKDVEAGKIQSFVKASPHCYEENAAQPEEIGVAREAFRSFQDKKVFAPWLCAYSKKL